MKRGATAAAILAIAAAGVAGAGEELQWERLFSADGAPPLHARVRYVDAAGREHRLELWRTKKALRRDTDGALSLVVERRAGGDDEYHVVQRSGDRAYDVSREQLHRIGSFPEWTQLATLLTRPRGDVRVAAMTRPATKTAAGACRWYEASTDKTHERICWSRTLKLPLAVEREDKGAWSPAVTVDEARPQPIAGDVFHVAPNSPVVDIDHDLD